MASSLPSLSKTVEEIKRLDEYSRNMFRGISDTILEERNKEYNASMNKDYDLYSSLTGDYKSRQISLHKRLSELYYEEKKNPSHPKFASDLLSDLVERDQLKRVVFDLYPRDNGFTISITGENQSRFPLHSYDEAIINYVDRGELHQSILDIIQGYDVFYDGCALVEIRDHRRSEYGPTPISESHYVLLKPSLHTLVQDLKKIAPHDMWSPESSNKLEAKLICETAKPLCLDPNPVVAVVANQVQYWKHAFHQPALKRLAKRYSQAARNKRKRCIAPVLPPKFKHLIYMQRKNLKVLPVPDKLCKFKQPLPNINKFSEEEIKFSPNLPILQPFENPVKKLTSKNPLSSLCKLCYKEDM